MLAKRTGICTIDNSSSLNTPLEVHPCSCDWFNMMHIKKYSKTTLRFYRLVRSGDCSECLFSNKLKKAPTRATCRWAQLPWTGIPQSGESQVSLSSDSAGHSREGEPPTVNGDNQVEGLWRKWSHPDTAQYIFLQPLLLLCSWSTALLTFPSPLIRKIEVVLREEPTGDLTLTQLNK